MKQTTKAETPATITSAKGQVKDYATDLNIETNVRTFLKSLNSGGGKPMEQTSPADARKVLEGAQKSVPVDISGIDVTEKEVVSDGISLKLYIVRPSDQKGILPVFMFYHGGGWILGDFPTHLRLVRDLVFHSGAVAVFTEYHRSPEAKFPTAINEGYAALKWVSEHGSEIQVDPSRLAVVGNSVGGNMAAVMSLMAKDKKGPQIKLQVLLWPVTNANFNTVSYQKYATDRFLTKNMMIWFWDAYATEEQRKNIYASPLLASAEELKGLPPALVQTAENDVLHDEGEAYARKLDEAGVPVTYITVGGMIHDYGLLNPIAKVPAVQGALRFAAEEIKFALK